MSPGELVALISGLSVVIAENIPDDDELNLLSNVFSQLGDTLATIAAQRSILAERLVNSTAPLQSEHDSPA